MHFQLNNSIETEPFLPRLLTKLTPPRLKQNILTRKSLLQFLIDKGDVKLVIVSAPAGYGKTTLLADYVRCKIKPCCWLSLDRTDCDPAILLENLVHTVSRVFPDFANPAQLLPNLIQAFTHPDNGIEICTRLLINQIYSNIQDDFAVIIDDYHLVEDVEQINRFMNLFLNYLPDNCQVILSCRSISPLDLSSLLLQGEVVGIGPNDLKMTPAEVYELLSEKLGLTISEEEAARLVKRTEGWIAGILLGSDKILRSRSYNLAFSTQEQLFNYIATEMFQRLPESLQSFLLQTSICEVIESDFCNRLLNIKDAPALIRECNRRQLLVNQMEEQPTKEAEVDKPATFYHHNNLLRQFLTEQLKQSSPNLYLELHRRAAYLYNEQGDMVKFITHLFEAQAYEQVATYLLSKSNDQLKAGHTQTLKIWLEALPPELFSSRPDLILLKAQVLGLNGSCSQAYELLNDLESQLTDASEASELLRVKATTLKARLLRIETKYESAIAVLEKNLGVVDNLLKPYHNLISDLTTTTPTAPVTDILTSVAESYLELGMSHGLNGDYSQALSFLEAARENFEKVNQKERLAHVHHCLSLTFEGLNNREAQKTHLEKSSFYWKAAGNLPGQVNTMVLLARFLLDNLELEQANQVLTQALTRTEQVQYYYGQAYVLSHKGDLSREQNRLSEAYEYYYKAKELAQMSNDKRLALLLRHEMAVTSRMLGDLSLATTTLNQALQILKTEDAAGNHYIAEVLRLGQIGLALDQENLDHAKKLLEEPFEAINTTKFQRDYAVKLFLEARLLYSLGKYNPALDMLKEALTLTVGLGKRPFLKQEALKALPMLQFATVRLTNVSESIRHVLVELIKAVTETLAAIGGSYAPAISPNQLALKSPKEKSIKIVQPSPTNSSDDQILIPANLSSVEPLVARAFGSMQVYVHGTPIKEWRTVKAWELLFLLLEENKPLRKETIIDLLWPDLPFGQADNLFRTTFHRLRKAVSPDWIIREGNLYSLKVSYWYDVDHFRKLAALGDKLSIHKETKAQALEAYQAANRLYTGNFLDALYSDWAVERQEALNNLWLQTLLKQAELELELGHPEQALATVDICLAQDKCNDATTLLQLRIYRQMRNPSLLTESYQAYCQNLKKEFNLKPSTEINSFYTLSLKELNAC